ncbi:alpha/beta fold hydrolase [Chitinophaga sp. CB10]|uniref:alpha/beta fold hydrolase n=1 Tax=Chitinophaga sp. CB10 TaxID=1891659 RepID=UPI0025BEC9B0|nr:alpha/beta fold hydrolase [Chitinophaga sp. CB10]
MMAKQTQVTLFLLFLLSVGCGITGSKEIQKTEDTYVLIHGGFHGAWCWDRLKPILEKKGFNVVCPDHPGMGKELYNYTDSVGLLLEQQQRPVILLGHSSGGMVISELAKRYPHKIKGLVYLSAFLLPDGMAPPDIMEDDTISIMQSSLIIDQDKGIVSVDKSKAKQLFYEDCNDSVAKWAIDRLTPEPIAPKNYSEDPQVDGLATVPLKRFYIETLHDKGLSIISQRRMQAIMPCDKVYTLESGHSPFLSQPDKLATTLIKISNILSKKIR